MGSYFRADNSGTRVLQLGLDIVRRVTITLGCLSFAKPPPDRRELFCLSPTRNVADLEQYLWQGLATLIATVSVAAVSSTAILSDPHSNSQVLITLFRHGRSTSRILIGASISADTPTSLKASWDDNEGVSSDCRGQLRLLSPWAKKASTSPMHQLQDKFLSLAIRISLYPISLIMINTVLTGELRA